MHYKRPKPLGIVIEHYSNGKKVGRLLSAFVKYDQIRINIYASNKGNIDIVNFSVVSAEPEIFYNSLPKFSNITLRPGDTNRLIFTTDLMNVTDLLELPQPINFYVKIKAADRGGNTEYKETNLSYEFVESLGVTNLFEKSEITGEIRARNSYLNMFDDDPNTFTDFPCSGTGQYSLVFDLKNKKTGILSFSIKAYDVDGRGISRIEILTSEDGIDWQELISSDFGCSGASMCHSDLNYQKTATLRYFKILVRPSSNTQIRIYDLRLIV